MNRNLFGQRQSVWIVSPEKNKVNGIFTFSGLNDPNVSRCVLWKKGVVL